MSKIEFTRDGLRQAIEKTYDAKIDDAMQEVANLESEQAYRAKLNKWRTEARARVRELAGRIERGVIEDAELDEFKVPSAPRRASKFDLKHAEVAVNRCKTQREWAIRRFEALEEQDTYTLTAKQLSDYFGI